MACKNKNISLCYLTLVKTPQWTKRPKAFLWKGIFLLLMPNLTISILSSKGYQTIWLLHIPWKITFDLFLCISSNREYVWSNEWGPLRKYVWATGIWQVWQLNQFSFCFLFVKDHRFAWRAITHVTPRRGSTILFLSSLQLPHLRLGPSKGFFETTSFKGPRLTSCVASGCLEKEGNR